MHLVVDIGNTNVVLGLFSQGALQKRWRLATRKDATADEALILLKSLVETPSTVRNTALASVVPSLQPVWTKALSEFFHMQPIEAKYVSCSSFKIDCDYPEQVGADRLCNVLACQSLHIEEAIVIDFGTATTFDIYFRNTYHGGVICPGLLTSMSELARRASRLYEVELLWNDNIIGKTTDDAIRNGMLYGTLGQVESIIDRILSTTGMRHPEVLATGGMAQLIGAKSTKITRMEEDLTLIGLDYLIGISSGSSSRNL
jgi:type III pantothenate kinase